MYDHFIDICHYPDDIRAPYEVLVWQTGRVSERRSHRRLECVAAFCKERRLPVLSTDAWVRRALLCYGIRAYPFIVPSLTAM